MTSVMAMSVLRVAQRVEHLEISYCIYGYLAKMRFATISVWSSEPDCFVHIGCPIRPVKNSIWGSYVSTT
jgi:hypothetical protein